MSTRTETYRNVAGLNRALRQLPKEASAELRDSSVKIAQAIADDARGRANRVGGVAKLVAPTIRGTRDRVPVVKMGSTGRLPQPRGPNRGKQTIGDVIFGAEFGGGKFTSGARVTTQFKPHLGHTGYFLWPTVRDRDARTQQEYSDALLRALQAV